MSDPIDATRGFVRSKAARDRERCDPCRLREIERRVHSAWWFVVCVRPRTEFRAIDWLDQRAVFAWTPVTLKRREWRAAEGRRTRPFPTAPGYAIAGLHSLADEWGTLLACPDVLRILQPPEARYPRPMRAASIRWIVANLNHDESEPEPEKPIEAGEHVRIGVGPFADLHGTVTELDEDDARIVLTMLGGEREIVAAVSSLKRIDG